MTSGNLTAGGLFANHEYGIFVRDAEFIAEISDDLCAYSSLGVPLAKDGLRTFCEKATSIQRAYKDAIDTRPKVELLTIQAALDDAEDDLIRHRLAGGDPAGDRRAALPNLLPRHILFPLAPSRHAHRS